MYYFLLHSPAENPGNCSFEPLKLKTFWGEQSPLVCSKFGGLAFRRNPCSGPPKDSKNYRKCVSKFYSTCRPRLLERWLTLNQRLNPPNQWLKVNRGLVSVARTPVSVNHGLNFLRYELNLTYLATSVNLLSIGLNDVFCKISETTWQLIFFSFFFFPSYCKL